MLVNKRALRGRSDHQPKSILGPSTAAKITGLGPRLHRFATSRKGAKNGTIWVLSFPIYFSLTGTCRLDGTAVVNGVFTIPLSGQPTAAQHGSATAPIANHPLAEFVAGPENLLAASALRPYLDQTATHYNPLVLHGPHGSGKSHLAQGLSQWWRQHFPGEKVLCLAGSEFAHAYAAAIEDSRLETWRRQTRGVELFVLDDLAQLSLKRGAQQELLHLLDALADRGSLAVLTARTLPTHWPGLLSGLRGRLSAGLAVPLCLPAADTRRAILEKLAAARGLSLPKRTVHSLADGLSVSVPVLISALLELELKARIDGNPVDHQRVRTFVDEHRSAKAYSLRDIAGLTAKYFGLKLSDMKSPLRRQPLVAGRGVAMYLSRQLTDKSLEKIGAFFGGRDHTTVLHACRRTERLLKRDRATRQAVAELKRFLCAL